MSPGAQAVTSVEAAESQEDREYFKSTRAQKANSCLMRRGKMWKTAIRTFQCRWVCEIFERTKMLKFVTESILCVRDEKERYLFRKNLECHVPVENETVHPLLLSAACEGHSYLRQVSENTSSQVLVPPFWDHVVASSFLSPSKHVEGTTSVFAGS